MLGFIIGSDNEAVQYIIAYMYYIIRNKIIDLILTNRPALSLFFKFYKIIHHKVA
jgi:hypothetical protein